MANLYVRILEPLVVDDLARSQARLVFGIELRGEDAAVGANREGAILGFAQERRRAPEPAFLAGRRGTDRQLLGLAAALEEALAAAT